MISSSSPHKIFKFRSIYNSSSIFYLHFLVLPLFECNLINVVNNPSTSIMRG
uniref:Uncharacterized protein n=1 Tax=Arundo donax TaxID=35708 RepID=A0A0A9H1V3_ARUDO